MSGGYAETLWRRARGFLDEAREARDPDLAAFFAEQAMQLAIKATLFEVFGERVRGHGLRELLFLLARRLEEAGFRREAAEIRLFVARERGLLVEAEEAYTLARYGETSFDWGTTRRLVGLAGRLLDLLERVVRVVKLG